MTALLSCHFFISKRQLHVSFDWTSLKFILPMKLLKIYFCNLKKKIINVFKPQYAKTCKLAISILNSKNIKSAVSNEKTWNYKYIDFNITDINITDITKKILLLMEQNVHTHKWQCSIRPRRLTNIDLNNSVHSSIQMYQTFKAISLKNKSKKQSFVVSQKAVQKVGSSFITPQTTLISAEQLLN